MNCRKALWNGAFPHEFSAALFLNRCSSPCWQGIGPCPFSGSARANAFKAMRFNKQMVAYPQSKKVAHSWCGISSPILMFGHPSKDLSNTSPRWDICLTHRRTKQSRPPNELSVLGGGRMAVRKKAHAQPSRLAKAPLAEVVFELRWALQGTIGEPFLQTVLEYNRS